MSYQLIDFQMTGSQAEIGLSKIRPILLQL